MQAYTLGRIAYLKRTNVGLDRMINMSTFLKKAKPVEARKADDLKTREIVEAILLDIENRGDVAIREYSQKFDNWNPESFILTQEEIQACIKQVNPRDIEDIKFAQEQVRNFALHQRSALKDIEVETLPGCLLYTSPSPRDATLSRMPSSA